MASSASVAAYTCAAILFSSCAAQPAAAARALPSDWTGIVHPQRGFAIAYPSEVFAPKDGAASEDGQVLVSRDGAAKLLVGAFDNTAAFSLDGYRRFLLEQNYTGARLDYERRKDRWFVISGTRGDTMFYERVTFVCGGRLINSWAMLYPVAERRLYDPIVERVARSYSPGAGQTGNCE